MNAPHALLPALDEIRAHEEEMVALRRQIHGQPELAYEEHATAELVAERLQRWGYEVHRGVAGTGVVGTLKVGTGTARIGLRADMDALPVEERSGKPWASKVFGRMHACGHDGHTAMLLSAARHLAASRNFNGTVHLVFQPAEEGQAGARRMLEEGFMERFPCDAIYGMHNLPGLPAGQFMAVPGFAMASGDGLEITVTGKGGHGAMPHLAVDSVVAAAHIVVALQTIVSRNVNPLHMGIVTIGAIQGGDAHNVIPGEVRLKGTVRAFNPAARDLMERRVKEVVQAQAAVLGATAEVNYIRGYPALNNHPEHTALCAEVVRRWRGEEGLVAQPEPICASEDFAFFLEKIPGCYIFIGNGTGEGAGAGDGSAAGCGLHHPQYDFNDRVLSTGASYWVRLVEHCLA